MKYIVVELQTNTDGSVGNLVWSYDSRNEAEQKYYIILSAAAVSTLPVHAGVLMTSDGRMIYTQCFKHETETDAE